MDTYQINYTDEALQDLRDIFNYISIALQAPGVATAQVQRIRDEVRSLNVFPKRCKVVDWEPWSEREMRQMPVDHFIVFYVVHDAGKAVQVVRIFYGKRDVPHSL